MLVDSYVAQPAPGRPGKAADLVLLRKEGSGAEPMPTQDDEEREDITRQATALSIPVTDGMWLVSVAFPPFSPLRVLNLCLCNRCTVNSKGYLSRAPPSLMVLFLNPHGSYVKVASTLKEKWCISSEASHKRGLHGDRGMCR